MIRFLTCLATAHDWRLVLLAAVICAASVGVTFNLYAKLPEAPRTRAIWLGIVGLVLGSGIWATHFVAMLAFEPAIRTGYEASVTVLSLVLAVVFCALGFWVASMGRGARFSVAAGCLLGGGVSVMHYTGMGAFRTSGFVFWDPTYVAVSLLLGVGFATGAMFVARQKASHGRQIASAVLLILGICGMHFTAMTAVTILPGPPIAVTAAVMSRSALALAVTGLTALIIVTSVGALVMDARGRKRAFDHIREAVDAMPDGLAIFDADDGLVAWNGRYEQAVAQSGDAPLAIGALGAAVLEGFVRRDPMVEPADLEAHVDARRDAWRAGGASFEQKTDDGRWLRIDQRRTERGGSVTVLVDVTALKRDAETLAQARDAADAANKAKSEFLANMSHEIRTPMNGIMGMNALLLRGRLTPDQKQYAEAVRVSADCLLGIINDILDVSKLEAGKVEIETIDFSLQSVVEDVVELLSTKAQEKSLEIASYLDDGARRALRGDPTRIRQVLLNLLSNALKFTEQGHVSVEVKSRPAGGDATALRLEVHDTGMGLSPEAKSKLFQKFQQADGSITRRFGGTGLGLSICRQLVELMGGTIGVEDGRDGGSVFWVELSLAHGHQAAPVARVANRDLTGVRILVVDDIELNRRIFQRQLEGDGAIVSEVDGGVQCLRAIKQADEAGEPYDIILLDHMMPDVAGDEVAEQIRSHAKWRQPKLVLASSVGVPLSSDRAASVGFDAFLTKPVRHQALVDCLAGLMSQTAGSAAPDEAVAADASATAPAGPGGRILLAEDNEINTMLARTLLEGEGYDVNCVGDGRQALEAVRDRQFDLVLMDVQMPVMDGLEATRLIRKLPGAPAQTPILAMTANAMASDVEACMDAGMVGHVAKPIDPEEFLRTVARFIANGAKAAPTDGSRVSADVAALPEVDDAYLARLAKMLPAARFNTMVDAYLTAAEQRLAVMTRLAAEQNLRALAAEAHDLKGTSGSFGARRLQRLAEHLELACQASDGAAAGALVEAIQAASPPAWRCIADYRAAPAAKAG